MKNRVFRILVTVVLVCCLLVSWSPIRVQAFTLSGTAAVLLGDDAIAIVLAILAGLGVCAYAESESSDLETRAMARNAMDAMETAGQFVKDGALTVYNSISESWSYAVSTDMVQWLHDWLFDSGSVAVSSSYGFDYSDSAVVQEAYSEAMSYPHHLVAYNTYYECWYFFASNSEFAFTTSDRGYSIGSEVDNYVSYKISSSASVVREAKHPNRFVGYFGSYSATGVTDTVVTSFDVSLGSVAAPGTEIETEYGEYIVIIAPNGVPDTGGDGGE